MSVDVDIALLIDRPAALADLAALYVAEWTPWYGPNGAGDAEADLAACLNRATLPLAVVAQGPDGRVLGTAALKNESLGAELGYGPWLAAVVVDPACRGRGIGSALIAAVERQARTLGFAALYTSTDTARSLVERRGWTPLRRTLPSLRGPVWLYSLALD